MLELLKKMDVQKDDFSKHWEDIEHCLELATKAEGLRERSRELREASRLLREESIRISREATSLYDSLFPHS